MNASTIEKFDFDEWKDLAVSNPDAFEALRLAWLDLEINSASPDHQPRLRGLQWQIDLIRQRYADDPSRSSSKIFDMMWDKVYGENGFVETLRGYNGDAINSPAVPDNLLAFKRTSTG